MVRRLGIDPDPPVSRLRGPDHPAEGAALPVARGGRSCPGGPAGPVRRRPGHPGDHRRGRRLIAELRRAATAWCGSSEMLPSTEVIAGAQRTQRFSRARRSTSRSASSTSRRWRARLAVVATATGGIPEVVVDGETGLLVPIEQVTDGTGTPLDPEQLRLRPCRGAEPGRQRPRACPPLRPGRAPACCRELLVVLDRRPDHGGLRVGSALIAESPAAVPAQD